VKRTAHVLIPNKITRIPSQFLFFDIETTINTNNKKNFIPEFIVGSYIYWRRPTRENSEYVEKGTFYDLDTFWKYIDSKVYNKKPLTVISHNIDFDWTVSKGYRYIQNRGWEVTSFVDKNPPFVMHLRKGLMKLNVVDMFNFFRGSVKEMGKSVGLDKLDIDFQSSTKQELEAYNMRDTEIIYTFFRKYLNFLVENDLGNFKQTISGQAFTTYRHKFMHHKIYIHNRDDALNVERMSYHGGRTEAFYIGKLEGEPFYNLDINSMYPFVMQKYKYPTRLKKTLRNPALIEVQKLLRNYALIGEFVCDLKEPVFPMKIHDKTCYPVGIGLFTLTTPEIKYALKKGYIKSCNVLYVYSKKNIFSEYVKFFYNLKAKTSRSSDNAQYLMTKLFLNSLYGKFGQRGFSWKKTDMKFPYGFYYIEDKSAATSKKQSIRVIGDRVEIQQNEGESYNSFPAIASHVTAYARMYLWKLIKTASIENVYYCDTDSLFVNYKGYMNLKKYIDATQLGKLKVEGTTNYLEIRGLKDYTFGSKVKIKGINKGAIEIDNNMFECERWQHSKTRMRKGNISEFVIEKYTKVLNRKYDKGIVTEDNRVIPFNLQDLEKTMQENEYEEYSTDTFNELKQKFKYIILKGGGINDPDYEDYPRWCKKKGGKTLDLFIDTLNELGFHVTSTDDVYNLLWMYK
jgi:hypothetical protein